MTCITIPLRLIVLWGIFAFRNRLRGNQFLLNQFGLKINIVNQLIEENESWVSCSTCHGLGKKKQGISKQARHQYNMAYEAYEKNPSDCIEPKKPVSTTKPCKQCKGTGLQATSCKPLPQVTRYPHIAIIGGGIGGTALALACMHRGIPFTLFERDASFSQRAQGYGLTLQQASKAMKELGILSFTEGVVSTKHVVHDSEGKIIGEWGKRKWIGSKNKDTESKNTNIHLPRQVLRATLLKELGGDQMVQWQHQLKHLEEWEDKGVRLEFDVAGKTKTVIADIVVGADGIRSTVRNTLITDNHTPLHYLDCMVILGICSLDELSNVSCDLLDGQTVFQTANGVERIYMMPFTKDSIMWQLSFPCNELEAIRLSQLGNEALKTEACRRTQWHSPIPQILDSTPISSISGYPVYDRECLVPSSLAQSGAITLLGDAAHPMSPFKGQGANQALLDALSLARHITQACDTTNDWKTLDLRKDVLNLYEQEMIERSSVKVKGSAHAAQFLHSDLVLQQGNQTMGAKWKATQ